ncbi:MAG TPA: hypothetical protein VK145_02830 [Candidatus Nanoarchaeia archaeon]|nr:hypothetical protein [Candidatus Nanoarchaeia archaeon]
MTLATHMVVGAAAAKVLSSHPVEAFVIGWISHYILDSVVHWDYPLSITGGQEHAPLNIREASKKLIAYDVGKVLIDVILGAIMIYVLSKNFSPDNVHLLVAGALGATIPDFLQFLYGVFKVRILAILQDFHNFMHAERTLKGRPIVGIAAQICVILIATYFFAAQL